MLQCEKLVKVFKIHFSLFPQAPEPQKANLAKNLELLRSKVQTNVYIDRLKLNIMPDMG